MLVTALSPIIGYDASSKVAKYAHEKNLTLRESVIELKQLSGADFDLYMRPELMIQPLEYHSSD